MPAWMVCRPASAVFLLQYDQSRLGEGSKSPSKVKLLPFCCQMLPILEALLCSWLHHPASPINHTIPLIQWNLSNIKVVGWEGLEPSTNALKGRCSTIELPTRSPAQTKKENSIPAVCLALTSHSRGELERRRILIHNRLDGARVFPERMASFGNKLFRFGFVGRQAGNPHPT
jgi:hypothetical protein